MGSISAKINLNGIELPVTITDDGHIFDNLGLPYSLPSGVVLDSATGNLMKDGHVVGNIAITPPTPPTPPQTDTTLTPTSTAGNGGNDTANPKQSIDDVRAEFNTTAAAAPGDIPNVSGRRFATASLADGGARPAVVVPEQPAGGDTPSGDPPGGDTPSTDNIPGGGDGGGDGGGGGGATDGGDTVDTNGGGGAGDGGDIIDTDGDGIPDDQDPTPLGYETGVDNGYPDLEPEPVTPSGASKWASTISGLSMGLSALQGLGQFAKSGSALARGFGQAGSWQTLGTLGRVAGVGGLALGGLGVFTSMMSLGENFTWGGLMSTLGSAVGYITSLWMLGLMSNPIGWIALGGIALTGYLMGLKKKDNDLDAANGDVTSVPNATSSNIKGAPATAGQYPSWTQLLPSQSIFMILAGVTSLGIGIDLSSPNVMNQVVQINAPQISSVRTQLSKATNKQVPENLLGKVFIKAGDGKAVPDKVVFVTQNGETGYNVNMVSLNPGGYLMGPDAPGAKMVPFFVVDPRSKSIVPNPLASNALGAQTAMAQTSVAPGVSAQGAAAAVTDGVMQGNYVQAPN